MSNLKDYVLSHVSPKDYYLKKFPEWNGDFNTNVPCPFLDKHEKGTDTKPSFSVNIQNKGGCFCHACGIKIGSIVHYEKLTTDVKTDDIAASKIYNDFIHPILDQNLDSYKLPAKIEKSLRDELAITDKTIERFHLGWNASTKRVTIPIFDPWNQLINVRLYSLPSMRQNGNYPKILNTTGYGKPAALFPISQLSSLCRGKHCPPTVYWMSGERDTLKAWDDGVPAFCYTTGENVCRKEWADQIRDFQSTIGIVQDNDKPGREGATKRKQLLDSSGIECFLLELEGDGVKDYSDYRREGGTVQAFLEYAKRPKQTDPLPSESPKPKYREIPSIFDPTKQQIYGNFSVADIGRSPELINKPITVKAIVSGKMDRTYSLPSVFEVGERTYQIPVSREILQFIRASDEIITKIIQGWLQTKSAFKVIEYITVTEIEIIPMIQPGVDTPYVNQRCFFFGPFIESNKPYSMTLIPATDMRSQETIGMITAIEPVSIILDSYKFNEQSKKLLSEEFHPNPKGSIYDNLKDLAHSMSEYFTGIRNRDDVHIATMLTWVSPLQFEFPYEGIQRGWLNTLIMGDTETGKSKVCQKLTSLFHCGVFINAENCSYVGLVGGAVKSSSGMFILRWGKIPLYNRQLVVVEELSGLSVEEISYMSDIRSAGVARYDKAGLTGETSAKTRLICLSNVRGERKSLADYNTGAEATQALIGHNEDLARFDLILTVSDDEVNNSIINADRSTEEIKEFSPKEVDAFKELIMFAWSLKTEQIDFTIPAYRACLQETLRMSKEYHPSLPIFKAGSGRLKLARIAVAIACVQFSWDEIREKLFVTDKHVVAAAELLDKLYRKPSFGYARYSVLQYSLQRVVNEHLVIDRVKSIFKDGEQDFYQFISNSNGFSKYDLSDAFGIHAMYAERVMSQMFLSNLLKKGEDRAEWVLSRAGRKWIEKKLTHE